MPVPPRYGFAVLQPGRYSSRPCGPPPTRMCYAAIVHIRFAPVSGGYTHRWLLATKPSGRPGSSRSGCWRRQCPSSRHWFSACAFIPAPCCPPQTARRFRINGVVMYSYSTGTARERGGVYPARTSSCAHSFGPSRPRPGRPSATRSVGLFRCSREPEVSLPRRSRALRPHASRPPPRPRSTAFRALGH